MNDWSKTTADKLKAKQKTPMTQDENILEQQRLKRANGDTVWSDVRSALRTECESLNREMGEQILAFEVAPSSELNVRTDVRALVGVPLRPHPGGRFFLSWCQKMIPGGPGTERNRIQPRSGRRICSRSSTVLSMAAASQGEDEAREPSEN